MKYILFVLLFVIQLFGCVRSVHTYEVTLSSGDVIEIRADYYIRSTGFLGNGVPVYRFYYNGNKIYEINDLVLLKEK